MIESKIVALSVIALIPIFLPPVAAGQDQGIPDTLTVAATTTALSGDYPEPFSLSISVFNDYGLKEIVVPLIIDGYSGWVHFDSVSFAGGRLADPNVLDQRQVGSFNTDSLTCDSLIINLAVASGDSLPAGSGEICDLWFRPVYGGALNVDSLPFSPQGAMHFTTVSDHTYTPRFNPGSITVACDYLIGDLRPDGSVNMLDLTAIHKGYLGCYDLDRSDPWHADVNCDRLTDLRDVVDLLDFVVYDSTDILCDCGMYYPAVYDDPGTPDTVWIEDDTLYVDIETTLEIGLVNDEILRGFALALAWDGDAVLEYSGCTLAQRLQGLNLFLENYECHGTDLVNPDTVFLSPWYVYDNIPPGDGAVVECTVIPRSTGSLEFQLVSYYTYYEYNLSAGGRSMLIGENKAAIIPTLTGGDIVVLPWLCGDVNTDGIVNILDITFLIDYLYNGPPAEPFDAADVNDDGAVNILDVTYLINYLYKGGPAPDCPA